MTSKSNMADFFPLSTNPHPPHDVKIQHGRLFPLSPPITTLASKRGFLFYTDRVYYSTRCCNKLCYKSSLKIAPCNITFSALKLGRSHHFDLIFKPAPSPTLERRQTREICEKQEKYFKGKVYTFTAQTLTLYQYIADLLTFLELYLKSSKYLKMGTSDLLAPFFKAILSGCVAYKVKKPVYVREMSIHLYSTAIITVYGHVSSSL